jgi:hypothetical protein
MSAIGLDNGYNPRECGSECVELSSESHKFKGTGINSRVNQSTNTLLVRKYTQTERLLSKNTNCV